MNSNSLSAYNNSTGGFNRQLPTLKPSPDNQFDQIFSQVREKKQSGYNSRPESYKKPTHQTYGNQESNKKNLNRSPANQKNGHTIAESRATQAKKATQEEQADASDKQNLIAKKRKELAHNNKIDREASTSASDSNKQKIKEIPEVIPTPSNLGVHMPNNDDLSRVSILNGENKLANAYYTVNDELYRTNLKAGVIFIRPLQKMIQSNFPPGMEILSDHPDGQSSQSIPGDVSSNDTSKVDTLSVKILNQIQMQKNLEAATVFVSPVVDRITAFEASSLNKEQQSLIDEQPDLDATAVKNNVIHPEATSINSAKTSGAGQLGSGANNSGNNFSSTKEFQNSFEVEELALAKQNQTDTSLGHITDDTKLKFAKNLDLFLPQLKSMVSRGGNQLRVKLNPENLGNLDFRLSKEQGKINAELITDNHDLTDYLKFQVDKLRQALLEQGIKLDNLSIKYQPENNSGGGLNFADQQSDQQSGQQPEGQFNSSASGQNKTDNPLEPATAKVDASTTKANFKSNNKIDLRI